MEEGKNTAGKGEHEVCHNPCTTCNKKGFLDNDEICPACAGTGCIDKKHCVPAGGLGCET